MTTTMRSSATPRRPSASMNSAGSGSMKAPVMIGSKPTLVEVPPMRFLIMDAPRQANLHLYIKECKRHNVTDIVRVCEPTYLGGELQSAGIELHEMAYEDGHSPPREVLDGWLSLVDDTFHNPAMKHHSTNGSEATAASSNQSTTPSTPAIAVHCVAGLGRAPVLVALALIEFANMPPLEAVALIRRHRRGAINEKQLIYVEGYRKQYKKRRSGGGAESSCQCVIS